MVYAIKVYQNLFFAMSNDLLHTIYILFVVFCAYAFFIAKDKQKMCTPDKTMCMFCKFYRNQLTESSSMKGKYSLLCDLLYTKTCCENGKFLINNVPY